MTDRKYADENLEAVVKFFRAIKPGKGMTTKSVVFNKGTYHELRYDFFFDKLKKHRYEERYKNERTAWAPAELKLGWKVADKDMTTRYNYKWEEGTWHVPKPSLESLVKGMTTELDCPEIAGDGLCIARHWSGAFSGGAPMSPDTKLLFLAYIPDHVLCDRGGEKLRVKSCYLLSSATLGSYVSWLEKNFKFKEQDNERDRMINRVTGELNYRKAREAV